MLKTIERAAKQATIFLKVMDEALPMDQKMLFLVDPDSEELYDLYNILGHSVEDLSNMDDDDLAEELYEMYNRVVEYAPVWAELCEKQDDDKRKEAE